MSESPDPTYDPPFGTLEINVIESKGLPSGVPPPQKEKDLVVKLYVADFAQQQRKFLTKAFTSKQVKFAESLVWNYSMTTPIYDTAGLLVFEVNRAASLLGSSTPYGSVAYKVSDIAVPPSNFVDNWLNLQDAQGSPMGQLRVSIRFTANLADSREELSKEPIGAYKFKVFHSSIHQAASNMFDSEKCRVSIQRCNNAVSKWLKAVSPLIEVININSHLEPMSPDVITTVWYRIVANAAGAGSSGGASSFVQSNLETKHEPLPSQQSSSSSMPLSMSNSFDYPYPDSGGNTSSFNTTNNSRPADTFVIAETTDPF